MPFWAWLTFLFLIAYNSFLLWRAWDKRQFKYGPNIYSLNDSPVYFWFFTVIFTACEIFLVTEFALVVVSTIWGPLSHT